MDHSQFNRRLFVKQMAFAAASLSTPGLWAEELTTTPRMTEGPFYPDKLPLDTDNDLFGRGTDPQCLCRNLASR